jgi:PBP1b-binding outer membrane lipoprotein LpoB
MKIKITTTILVVAIMLTGCSSTVQILSEPSGADVEINGKSYGKSPVTTSLRGR